jgi:hypothetical protein
MDNNEKVNIQGTNEEEQQLSQKLSQLFASETDGTQAKEAFRTNRYKRFSTDNTLDTISKKLKTFIPKENDGEDSDDDKEELEVKDQIPNYLSVADNSPFQKLIQTILSKTANSYSIEDFQIIALLLREITLLDLQKSLWNTYLQSGTGQLLAENQL